MDSHETFYAQLENDPGNEIIKNDNIRAEELKEGYDTVYNYSYGNEDILGATINITHKKKSDEYVIIFTQESFFEKSFSKIEPSGLVKLMDSSITNTIDDLGIITRTYTLKIEEIFHLLPEKLFVIK